MLRTDSDPGWHGTVRALVAENLAQEEFGSIVLRIFEEFFGFVLLDNLAAVHEDDAV